MLVRMKTRIGGYRNGETWPEPGGTIDVPEHEAADLIGQHYAEEIASESTADDDEAPTEEGDAAATEDSGPEATAHPVVPTGTRKRRG